MNWLLIKNSMLVGGLATLLAVGFGFLAALCLAGLEGRWRSLLIATAIMALALPPFVATNCWLHYLGTNGVWRAWLPFGIISLGGTAWILSLLIWPITLLAVGSAWRRLEAAQLESDTAVAGWWLIRGLLFPVARTALTQAAVLSFVLALNNFAVPAILQVKVFPAEIWVRFNTTFDTVGALSLSWPLVVGPLVLPLWFARRDVSWPRLQEAVPGSLFRRQLGPGWFGFCVVCTLAICLLSVGLPVFQLISVSRTWTELGGAVAAGKRALWNSTFLAAAAASVILALALLCGLFRKARSRSRFDFVGLFLWLPFFIPGLLMGIGFITVFNRPWLARFYQSLGIVVLAFVIRYLALGWNTVVYSLRGVDQELTDAARIQGASRWQMLRHVYWPQIAPQTAAAWYVVFLLCLWDVESIILVMPPGGETLALRIFNLLHYGHNAQVNALCLALLVLAVTPLVIWRAFCISRAVWQNLGPRVFSVGHFGLWLAALGMLSLSACAPPSTADEAIVQSQIFSRVKIIGTRGVGVGELNKPRSVAVDLQDNLYVVDMTGRVQKFSSNGVYLLSWQMPQTDKGKPKGMCRDRDGNIVVLEPHYQRVNYYSPEGKLLAQWGQYGTNAGQLSLPRAVAIDSHNRIFVSEYEGIERVQQFSPRGEKLLNSFGHAGNGPGEFNRAEGLFVDSKDQIYVADSCNHRIEIFSSDGKFLRAYGKPGTGKGELSYPYDICVDAAGRQYVSEFGNSRIQVFGADDRPLEIIGGPGAGPGQFSNPWGLALDSAGNLYVADSQNHRVQKFIHRAESGS